MDFKLKKSDLNFRVYTATETPETGNENDIVIISDTPMKNWILSPEKPSGVPRNDGDVCIQYSVTDGAFNVVKNNVFMIATICAWQYVSGTWVSVKAMCYQNGMWNNWVADTYLYKAGDEYTHITGGWSVFQCVSDLTTDASYGSNANGVLKACLPGTEKKCVGMGTNNKIDLTPYKTLTFNVIELYGGACQFGVTGARNGTATSAPAIKHTQQAVGLVTLDVSELSGEYYIWFGDFSYSSGKYGAAVNEIQLLL